MRVPFFRKIAILRTVTIARIITIFMFVTIPWAVTILYWKYRSAPPLRPSVVLVTIMISVNGNSCKHKIMNYSRRWMKLFHCNDQRIFCTRGSFSFDQALKTEKIFNRKYKDVVVMKECTYLPWKQNSCRLWHCRRLVFFIAIKHTKTAKTISIEQPGFRTVKKIIQII